MITFKLTTKNIKPNTFIISKKTPIGKALNNFGYIKVISKKGAIVLWYNNFIKSELNFSIKELHENYKSVYPYFNTSFVRGNIWKHSYATLLGKIHPELGFSKIKVDKMTYKKPAHKGMNVIITDAVYVLSNGLSKLQGRIYDFNKKDNEYTIATEEGYYAMTRCSFAVLPQDYFILLSVRCN